MIFLELPLSVFKEWFVFCEVVCVLESKIKINKVHDFIGQELYLNDGMKLLTVVLDSGGNKLDMLTNKTS